MDGQRFDALARRLAARRSRRQVLRGLAGGAAAVAAALAGPRRAGASTCEFDWDCSFDGCTVYTCNEGTCEVVGTEPCDWGDPCQVGTCIPGAGCEFSPAEAGTVCGEGDACAGPWTCDGAGACQPGEPVVCDDGNPCTANLCDPWGTGCYFPAVYDGTPCGDGGYYCVEGTCVAAPANDDRANAVLLTLADLDFVHEVDTRAATSVGDPSQWCNWPNHTVWYVYQAGEDRVLQFDTAGSSYNAGVDVYDAALQHVACSGWGGTYVARAGQTYYLMVSGDGGTLVFALRDLGAPLVITAAVDPVGTFTRTGAAVIGGTVTCSQASGFRIQGKLRQKLGRQTIISGEFWVPARFSEGGSPCDGTARWTATVYADNGAFGGGAAEVIMTTHAGANNGGSSDVEETTAQIRLSGK